MVDNEAVKNTKFNTLKATINSFDVTTLIHINQYRTDKQNLEKKNWKYWWKIPAFCGLVTTTVLNTNIG